MSTDGEQETLRQLTLGPDFGNPVVVNRAPARPAACGAATVDTGILEYRGQRQAMRGLALALAVWVADHLRQINEAAPRARCLLLTWSSDDPRSITGDIEHSW